MAGTERTPGGDYNIILPHNSCVLRNLLAGVRNMNRKEYSKIKHTVCASAYLYNGNNNSTYLTVFWGRIT